MTPHFTGLVQELNLNVCLWSRLDGLGFHVSGNDIMERTNATGSKAIDISNSTTHDLSFGMNTSD
jgi:hypothetical protein